MDQFCWIIMTLVIATILAVDVTVANTRWGYQPDNLSGHNRFKRYFIARDQDLLSIDLKPNEEPNFGKLQKELEISKPQENYDHGQRTPISQVNHGLSSQAEEDKEKCKIWTSPEGIQYVLKNSMKFPVQNVYVAGSIADEFEDCDKKLTKFHKFSPPYYSPGSASKYFLL